MQFLISLDPLAKIPLESIPLLYDRLAHLEPALLPMAQTVAAWNQKNFDSAGETFGRPWPENTEATRLEKERQGYFGGTLVRTGWLRANVGSVLSITRNSFAVGVAPSEVPYVKYLAEKYVLVGMVDAELSELTDILTQYLSDVAGLPPGAVQVQVNL